MQLHEDQTSLNSAGLTRPLGFAVADRRVGYTTDLGRWRVQPNAGYVQYRFDNVTFPGATLSQRYRDRDEVLGGVTVRYNVQANRSAVVVVRGNSTDFVGPFGGQPRPNSTSVSVLAGVDYAFSGALRALALIGYQRRNFASSAYQTRSEPIAQGWVVWTPTRLTTITGQVSRTVEDSVGESIAGVTYTHAGLALQHEYLRNLLLGATAGVDTADYAQSNGSELLTSAGVTATYLFNRNVRLGASYSFIARSGSNVGLAGAPIGSGAATRSGDYTRNVALLQLSFSP